MKIGKYFKLMHKQSKIFHEHQKSKASKNCPRTRVGRRSTSKPVSLVRTDLARKHIGPQEILHEMPIRMWLARQRATSRNYNEFGNERPCSHCGSAKLGGACEGTTRKTVWRQIHGSGVWIKTKEFSFQRLGLTRDSVKKSDSSTQQNTQGCADLDQHNRLSSVSCTSHCFDPVALHFL